MAKHQWATYADEHPDEAAEWHESFPRGVPIDNFAGLDRGIHNGPRCVRCGKKNFCMHYRCSPQVLEEDCPGGGE